MAEFAATETLAELLADELAYDATTRNDLTNHLPMAIVAKAAMGASPEELSRFARRYRRRLVPVAPPGQQLNRSNWRGAVGVAAAYPDLVDYFDREVAELGIDETLRAHVGHLVNGVSGAAFHGVIRLAYALDVHEERRVSTGLAYLAASATALGPLEGGTSTSDDPEVLLTALATSERWRTLPSARLISEQMLLVANDPDFAGVTSSLSIDDQTFSRLTAAALKVYASTNNFTALHGVTGLEALSKIRPYVDDTEQFDRSTFQSLAAAYLSIGAPSLWSSDRVDDMVASVRLDPSTVIARAACSDDEHVALMRNSA